MTLFILESAIYYEAGSHEVVSIHATYAGALSAAGRYMTERDWSDPHGTATRTYYKRRQPYGDSLDEWAYGDAYLTLKPAELER